MQNAQSSVVVEGCVTKTDLLVCIALPRHLDIQALSCSYYCAADVVVVTLVSLSAVPYPIKMRSSECV